MQFPQCASLHWGVPLYTIFLLWCAFKGQMETDLWKGQIETMCCALIMAHSLYIKIQSIMICVLEMVTGSMCVCVCVRERERERERQTERETDRERDKDHLLVSPPALGCPCHH